MIKKKKRICACLATAIMGACFLITTKGCVVNGATSETLEVEVTKPYVEMSPDIVYSQTFGMENTALKMDVLKPKSEEKLPAVVFVTGGAFLGSPKTNYI